jgi:ubiquinone/menaquinone biosynthesis C-methylase UbiE
MRTHDQTVHDQFDPRAQAYLTSAVHAEGPDLAYAKRLVEPTSGAALDVGCGAGHLSFALAPAVARMVAVDPSPNMLATVAGAAASRGLTQIETQQANAESLPFADASFALVCTRYSAHHWIGLPAALREMHRVLQPGGHFLIIDVLGADDALVDTHLQALELLRDPSHVRDRTQQEWRSLLDAQGCVLLEQARWPIRLAFTAWVERMHTPQERVAVIRSLQLAAPREVQQALALEPDGSFSVQTGLFWGRKSS